MKTSNRGRGPEIIRHTPLRYRMPRRTFFLTGRKLEIEVIL